MVDKSKFDLPFVPMREKSFESGYYWVKFEMSEEWDVAWLQLERDSGEVIARSSMDHRARMLKPGRDEVGHKIVREAPVDREVFRCTRAEGLYGFLKGVKYQRRLTAKKKAKKIKRKGR